MAANLSAGVGERPVLGSRDSAAASPAFAAASTNPWGLSNVGYFANPTLVDIDGDGDLDAFIGNGDGSHRERGGGREGSAVQENAFHVVDALCGCGSLTMSARARIGIIPSGFSRNAKRARGARQR